MILGITFIFGGYFFMQKELNSRPITLICSKPTTTNNVNVTVSYIFNYLGNNVDNIYYKVDFDYSKLSDNELNILNNFDACSLLNKAMENRQLKFADCNKEVNNKHLIVTAVVDKSSFGSKKIKSADAIKDTFEKENFKCESEEDNN